MSLFGRFMDSMRLSDDDDDDYFLDDDYEEDDDNYEEEDNYEEIKEALLPNDFNFIVTPKEIDELIENMSKLISYGINMSL